MLLISLTILTTRRTSYSDSLIIVIECSPIKKQQQQGKTYPPVHLILLYRLIIDKKTISLLIQIFYLYNLIDYVLSNQKLSNPRNLIILLLLYYINRFRLIKSILINVSSVSIANNVKSERLILRNKSVLRYQHLIVSLLMISVYLEGLLTIIRIIIVIRFLPSIKFLIGITLYRN